MPKRIRRRPVHYITFTFADGAAVTCAPARKPTKKSIKDDGIQIDADHVFQEHHFSAKEFDDSSDSVRIRMCDLLTNRLNMRRTVRELVLPSLANIETALRSLNERLNRIEQVLAQAQQHSGQSF